MHCGQIGRSHRWHETPARTPGGGGSRWSPPWALCEPIRQSGDDGGEGAPPDRRATTQTRDAAWADPRVRPRPRRAPRRPLAGPGPAPRQGGSLPRSKAARMAHLPAPPAARRLRLRRHRRPPRRPHVPSPPQDGVAAVARPGLPDPHRSGISGLLRDLATPVRCPGVHWSAATAPVRHQRVWSHHAARRVRPRRVEAAAGVALRAGAPMVDPATPRSPSLGPSLTRLCPGRAFARDRARPGTMRASTCATEPVRRASPSYRQAGHALGDIRHRFGATTMLSPRRRHVTDLGRLHSPSPAPTWA